MSREAGSRTKIAVASNEEGVDPIGSCVGQKGTRVQAVIDELGGEKIDIIEWNDDVARFISNALSPAKVLGVKMIETKKKPGFRFRPTNFRWPSENRGKMFVWPPNSPAGKLT